MREVRFSGRAQRDLTAIFAYLMAESPPAAFRVTDRLEQASLELADRALHYAVLDRYKAFGFRRRTVGSYGIFYIVRDDVVEVIAILHSARDADAILFPED